MSRSKAAEVDKPMQDEPTRPRPRDAMGLELDQWGLPLCGPIRVQRLAELNLPDPNFEPEAWAQATSTDAAAGGAAAEGSLTEGSNG